MSAMSATSATSLTTRVRPTLVTSLVMAALTVLTVVVVSCGSSSTSKTTVGSTTTPATVAPTTVTTTPTTTTPTTPTTTVPPLTQPSTTSTLAPPQQKAVWPAADVVFSTPEAAAKDFLAHVFQPGPTIGEFKFGDSRSGEFEVFATDETGKPIGTARSFLILRQLGPSDGWFVLGAASNYAAIFDPESQTAVKAGPVTVSGRARGFEANVAVKAFIAGKATPLLDMKTTMAGNLDTALPFSVTLDLSAAKPGDVVVLMVHGGAGLETDPGDFGAIPIVIAAG